MTKVNNTINMSSAFLKTIAISLLVSNASCGQVPDKKFYFH